MKILGIGPPWKGVEERGRGGYFSLGALLRLLQVMSLIAVLGIFKIHELTKEGKKVDDGEIEKNKIVKYLFHNREVKKNIGHLDVKKKRKGRKENMKINSSSFSTLMKTKILGKIMRKIFPSPFSF